ncbi:ComEC/Rec2 family competence protein [Sulfoacidibacillus thermotolerans]|uniref:ComEC/Rec2-related protein domain-containing protein n=1 Tax=Sulfoacidibacillus thermotolerans TaxID=1765684 RepID=A0A2U3D7D0_SULT2|nr:ComEC/Rec2 family competence protein [Sulfoacidibacillus thermotolerans]PWI57185.1 hypothetical protein BM613_09970 [Sulfoacidibacillus thermotolerans]
MYRLVAIAGMAFCVGVVIDLKGLSPFFFIFIGWGGLLLSFVAVLVQVRCKQSGIDKGSRITPKNCLSLRVWSVNSRQSNISKLQVTRSVWIFSLLLVIVMGIGMAVSSYERGIHDRAVYSVLDMAKENSGGLEAMIEIDGELETTTKEIQVPGKLLAIYSDSGLQRLPMPVMLWLKIYRSSNKKVPLHRSATQEIEHYYVQMGTLQPFDVLNVYVRIKQIPPGPFATALLRKHIFLLGEASVYGVGSVSRLRETFDLGAWQGIVLNDITRRVQDAYGNMASSLLLSFALGDRTNVDRSVLQVFTALGIIHAVVASGATIRMTVAPLVNRLKKVLRGQLGWYLTGLISIILLFFGAGFAPPAVRAGIVYGYELTASVFQRPHDRLTANVISLVCLTVWMPQLLFDPGVILSYGAAVTLVLLPKQIENRILYFIRWKFARHILSRGIAGQIGISPLVMEEFGQFPYFSLFINIFLYPILEWIIPFSFLLCIAACLNPAALAYSKPTFETVATFFHMQILALHGRSLSLYFTKPPLWILIAYYVAILFIFIRPARYTSTIEREYFS